MTKHTMSIPDFVKIRKGTESLTALKKIIAVSKEYILSNSKNLKVKETIVVNFKVLE